jgi:hypothetical protein
MSFIFMETYIILLINFLKNPNKYKDLSLGCELHFLQIFHIIISIFYCT